VVDKTSASSNQASSNSNPALTEPKEEEPSSSSRLSKDFFTAVSQQVTIEAHVSETINVLFRDGGVEKLLLTGEVAFRANSPSPQPSHFEKATFIISNYSQLGRVAFNEKFASVSDNTKPDTFTINMSELVSASSNNNSVPVLKYQVRIDESDQDFFAPLFINVIWKCEETATSALVAYQHNLDMDKKLNFRDLVFWLSLEGGGEVQEVQSKPNGSWDATKRVLMWSVGDLDWNDPQTENNGEESPTSSTRSSYNEPQKLLARFQTTSAANGGSLQVSFSTNELLTIIDFVPVELDSYFKFNGARKHAKTGKYATIY
jgi:hypothetical protein